jgi:hypothetical protein
MNDSPLTPHGLALKIREKVKEINALVMEAARAEVDVEFMLDMLDHAPRSQTLTVYISQEV